MSGGIVSILQEPDHCQQTKAPNATTSLSADMSSKKWLAQNGMKNFASFQRFSIQGEQNEFRGKREVENPSQLDVWSSILSKQSEDKEVESPYVHPLVKKSSSSLSKKSLEICTDPRQALKGSPRTRLQRLGTQRKNQNHKQNKDKCK